MRGARDGRHVALDGHSGLGPSLVLGQAHYLKFSGVNLWVLGFSLVVPLVIIAPYTASNLKTILGLKESGTEVASYSKGVSALSSLSPWGSPTASSFPT